VSLIHYDSREKRLIICISLFRIFWYDIWCGFMGGVIVYR
jgi:hypothetical protein